MKTIYGMAKCYLNLGGSRARNFELDYLRLALVADRDPNCEAVYLAAPIGREANRIAAWNRKYAGSRPVVFVPLDLSAEERQALEAEKSQQNASNRSEADEITRSEARATYGEKLCEDKLAQEVSSRHQGVRQQTFSEAPHLSGIQWDYFGTLAD